MFHTDFKQAITLDLDLSDPVSPAHPACLGTLETQITVDLDKPGKQHGHLILPRSESPVQAGYVRIPVCVIQGSRPGPTVTMVAGVHGDEFEGPITLHNMARELSHDQVHGRIILLPVLNLAGMKKSQRCSPLDDRDLDTCFPGNSRGSISERVAYEIFERFIRLSDLVIDLRSGGSTLQFTPLVAVRSNNIKKSKTHRLSTAEQKQQQASEDAMFAFGAPFCVRLPGSAPNSCLQGSVAAAGIAYVQTELGGGGSTSAETLSTAQVGCYNVLRQQKIIRDDIHLLSSRILEVKDSSFYIYAEHSGILETHARLGANVYKGDKLASISQLSNCGSKPNVIPVSINGVMIAVRHAGLVKAGELIAILADEVPT